MTRHPLQIRMAALLALVLAVAGCVAKPSPPTSFYMLGPLAPAASDLPAATGEHRPRIAVQPVRIPAYLDRNQIVTRLGDSEYRLADFNHWAEPLSDNLTGVIAENLSRMLAEASADVFPAASPIPFDYSVDVEVLRLDGKMNDEVSLVARWAIFGPEERDLILLKKSTYREPVAADSYQELVLASSRAVEKLCRDVAEALKRAIGAR